jgi:putative ABC transport system ATP-binding protein
VIAVSLERVEKVHGTGDAAVLALREVSLEIAAGESVAVIGPSASGKSTLLNLVSGIDTATRGRVCLFGEELGTLSDAARSDRRLRDIGFVFQTFNLLPTFTAQENVAWPRRFRGESWREARAAAAAMLDAVGLDARAHRRVPAELSGGEQQRVAIARALVNGPRLLLADEPTGNLDSEMAGAILDLIARVRAERGLTVVLVTHNAAAAARAERTVRLRDGRVVADGDDAIPRRARHGRS